MKGNGSSLSIMILRIFLRSGLLNDGFDSSPFTSARGGPDLGDMSVPEIKAKQQQLINGISHFCFV